MSLEVILGPMFSGKSSRILSIVSRYSAIGMSILVIKHSADNRYSQNEVATHDGRRAPCVSVGEFSEINEGFLRSFQVIVVEEAQFFRDLVQFVKYTVDDLHKNVFLVGLDGDSERRPFGEILQCIPLADRVEKITALCGGCANGAEAIFTRRRVPCDRQMVVAGSNLYEAVCRSCYHYFNARDAVEEQQ